MSHGRYSLDKDSDFLEILLISFPFSEILSQEINARELRNELSGCLNRLRNSGASVLAIACNTLHAFLDENDQQSDLVHLPRFLAKTVPKSEIPLVLCASTSLQFELHRRFFGCGYPNPKVQAQVGALIDDI